MAARVTMTSMLVLSCLLGCDRGESGAPAITREAAQAGVDSAMRSHFRAFERGELAAWSGMFAEHVFFVAADPAQVFVGRDAVRSEMETSLVPTLAAGVRLTIEPRSGLIWIADGGQEATATYNLDYSVSFEQQKFTYPLRSSYLLEQDTTGWRVLAAQYSRPLPYDTLFMWLAGGRIIPPAPMGGEAASTATELVRQFRSDLGDIRNAPFDAAATVVTPGSVAEGAEAARRDLAQWLGPAGSATERGDGLRGQLTESGTVGWVAANLNVPIYAGPESLIAPMRALFVYRLVRDRWEIIQASLSVGVRDPS